jgi:predicted phosphodiesterase
MNTTNSGQIILNELEKLYQSNSEAENIPTKTIAKMIFKKYPGQWVEIDTVRSAIRKYRGNMGNKSKDETKDKRFYRENRTPERALKEFNFKPIDLSIADFEFKDKKPLIMGDIHIPYHSIQEVETAIQYGLKNNIDSIYLNGDILDCGKISKWATDPRMVHFDEEREMFFSFVEYLQQLNLPIYFKIGNHEERIEHYQMRNAPELARLDDMRIPKILHLEELGITVINDKQICNMGKLIVIHGHEFGESTYNPVNPARGIFNKAKYSVLAGHNHQTSTHHENNLRDDSMACFSVGALCNLRPTWRPFAFTKWNYGFAIVEIEDDGNFEVHNKRIIDKKVR